MYVAAWVFASSVYVNMYVCSLMRKQINVSSDTHFPVKFKETQSANRNKESKGRERGQGEKRREEKRREEKRREEKRK